MVEKKRGERVRVKQRGWDALNRTQTARSLSAKRSQFIFVTAKYRKNPVLLTTAQFFSNYSTVRISGPPSVTYTVCSNWQILPPSAQAKTWYVSRNLILISFLTSAFHLLCRLASSASGNGFSNIGNAHLSAKGSVEYRSSKFLASCAPSGFSCPFALALRDVVLPVNR